MEWGCPVSQYFLIYHLLAELYTLQNMWCERPPIGQLFICLLMCSYAVMVENIFFFLYIHSIILNYIRDLVKNVCFRWYLVSYHRCNIESDLVINTLHISYFIHFLPQYIPRQNIHRGGFL